MPLYQMKCRYCGHEFEIISKINDYFSRCPECEKVGARRIPAVRGPKCINEDAEWIRSVTDVVDKTSTKPHVRAFLKYPTRENYKAWMQGEGLRPLENLEKHKKPKLDIEHHAGKIMEEKAKRERYEVRG